MFLGRVTNWTSVVGADVPFTTVINTNNKIVNRQGAIDLKRPAVWDIDATLVLTGVADDVIVSVWADGVETGAYAEATVTATTFTTVSLIDAVRTVLAQSPDVATISVRVDTAGVTVSGSIRVAYVD